MIMVTIKHAHYVDHTIFKNIYNTRLMGHVIVMAICCISQGVLRLYQILYELLTVVVRVWAFSTQSPKEDLAICACA